MGLRICLVTPFAWSQPHDVNEHVAGVAGGLRALGHSVTVLASSNRARDLAAGRRALLDGLDAEVVALGPAVPISRRSRIGVPVGARANLSLALALGRFDVIHGFEPGLPSLSYLALRDAQALTVASFLSAERLGYPPGKAQRDRLRGRIDALVATSEETAAAAAVRFPGQYHVVSEGVDLELFRAGRKRKLIVVEWRPNERAVARAALRALHELPDWELVLLRTKPLTGKPTTPRLLRDRVHVRTARDGTARAALLAEAAIFLPALAGLRRVRLEAAAASCAIASPPGVVAQPELAAAEMARLAENADFRLRKGDRARAEAEAEGFDSVARDLEELYRSLTRRRQSTRGEPDPLADRPWILCDLHMHTSWSHDCVVDPADLIMYAEGSGLGAIAVTDHNVFGGALETAELAREHELIVIPGEEVKTDGQGEVIGLFLREEIPRGMSFAETVAAIKEQNGLVYLPHPFDRMHSIADPATLQRHLADIDVFEVYNARLLFESYNDEALRFARKYNLTMGPARTPTSSRASAPVPCGCGPSTGATNSSSASAAQVLRRPRSLVYLQSLKWMAQAKERVR